MIRRSLSGVILGAVALVSSSFAQDLEGLPTTGLEKAKVDSGDVLLRLGFTFDSAVVPDVVRARVDGIAAELVNERASVNVEVAGHTDSVGSDTYNQFLSEKRAEAVKAYLVEHGVMANRISVVGYGESQPRDTNDTVEGRRRNRRVEIAATP